MAGPNPSRTAIASTASSLSQGHRPSRSHGCKSPPGPSRRGQGRRRSTGHPRGASDPCPPRPERGCPGSRAPARPADSPAAAPMSDSKTDTWFPTTRTATKKSSSTPAKPIVPARLGCWRSARRSPLQVIRQGNRQHLSVPPVIFTEDDDRKVCLASPRAWPRYKHTAAGECRRGCFSRCAGVHGHTAVAGPVHSPPRLHA